MTDENHPGLRGASDMLDMTMRSSRTKHRVMAHSDLVSNYGNSGWFRFHKASNLELNMGRRGNSCGVGVAESFFGSLKELHHEEYL